MQGIERKTLPEPDSLLTSHQEVKKLFKIIRLPSEFIHVYKNDCILLKDEHKDLDVCPIMCDTQYCQDLIIRFVVLHKAFYLLIVIYYLTCYWWMIHSKKNKPLFLKNLLILVMSKLKCR